MSGANESFARRGQRDAAVMPGDAVRRGRRCPSEYESRKDAQ